MIDLAAKKEEAKRIARAHLFMGHLETSLEPIQMRMHERKVLFAYNHIRGEGTADLLIQEAALRELTVDQLAGLILAKAEELNQLEIRRMTLNVKIDAATKISDIGHLLDLNRIPRPPRVDFFDPEGPETPAA
jgi:hypothetical protein